MAFQTKLMLPSFMWQPKTGWPSGTENLEPNLNPVFRQKTRCFLNASQPRRFMSKQNVVLAFQRNKFSVGNGDGVSGGAIVGHGSGGMISLRAA
jgi:hypothetical protein